MEKEQDYISDFIIFLKAKYGFKKKPLEINELFTTVQLNDEIGKAIIEIAKTKKYVSLLAESGLLDYTGFISEAFNKLGKKILPDVVEDEELTKDINKYFHNKTDYKWLDAIPTKELADIFLKIKWPQDEKAKKYIEREILNSIIILSQKIASIGIEREVVAKISKFDDLDSPFIGLNREVTLFVEKILGDPNSIPSQRQNDFNQIMVMLSQCASQMSILYKHKDQFGISLKMTVLIRKLEKYFDRLKNLLEWIQAEKIEDKALISAIILKEVVKTQNTKNSLRKHFKSNLEFISFKIVENTSKSGELYIASTKREYWKLFRRALGGGVIVAFLCWFKTSIYFQFLPAIWTAFFYSLNYALGFVLIHVLKYTLATKQPAMTASTIAESLSNNGKNPDWLNTSTKLLIRQIRSQFISLVGNAIIALPMAFIIGWVYYYFTGTHIASPSKALILIKELNIFKSLAIFHAAIAGIYLMLSGLVSGYYENVWVYNNLHQRIIKNERLNFVFGTSKIVKMSSYIGNNIGGISGSIFLGFCLGSTGIIGRALGLDIDIRHITFASGNFGIAFASLNNFIEWPIILNCLLGITIIGVVNVFVSFGLSILIALNSRGTKFLEIKQLFSKLFYQLFSNGTTFFYPSKVSKINKEQDSSN
jgi:site-specific recombinase